MSVTRLAISRNRVTGVLLLVLIISGLTAYADMPQKMDPGFIIRTAQIITRFPGASPDRVEKLVTDPIEEAAQSISELDFVSSTSRTGVSVVFVQLRAEFKDVRPIWDELRRLVADVRLPAGAQPPMINDELGDIFPMLFSMTGDGFSDRELAKIAELIRDDLMHIDGVAKVEILGEQEERVFVEYNDARLSQLGLSPSRLQQILASRNIIMSGGEIDIGPETLVLEPSGNFLSIEELERTLIPLPRGGLVHLGDITDVRRGYVDPPRGLVTVLGRPALTLAVSVSDSDNLVSVGSTVKQFFDALPSRYPHGIDFELTYFQPDEVQEKIGQFGYSVIQAVVIVLVVMLLTLGLRTGFVVSTLIPSAMIIAVWVMSLIGETINQMTLASLIIALGLLVDNAIVVSEAILVRISRGENAVESAVAAAGELRTPLLISSLTTAAAFLPIFLAESEVGEYTGALFKVVTITLLVSWALSITVIPMLATVIMRPKKSDAEPYGGGFYDRYRRSLRVAVRHRWVTLAITAVIFAASLGLWSRVPQIFFPNEERAFLMAAFNLPAGTSMEATQAMAARIDDFIEQELRATDERDGVTSWTTFIGETPPAFRLGYAPSPSLGGYCELMVHTSTIEAAVDTIARMHRFAMAQLPDVETDLRMLAAGPPAGTPVQIRISGTDIDEVFRIVDATQAKLRQIAGTVSVSQNWGARVKKLAVAINEERARRAGISNQEAALALSAFASGLESTRYREEDDSIPVILRSVASGRRDLDRLRNIAVTSAQTGRTSPLSQIADIDLRWEPSAILRYDRYRTVTVMANVEEGVTPFSVFAALQPWLEEQAKSWPAGYRWKFGGEFESSVKANESIADKLPIAGLLIVLLLVLQFNSLRKPAIVLSTIILALIGVAIGLVVMDSYFGFMTLLGVVSLAGIVVNNAIVLIDRIDIELAEGRPPQLAVVEAAQQRVRPILLTTATTVASLLPLYLTGGAMWQPMAVAITFGLVFSTLLTLVVVPALYSVFYRVPRA